MKYFICILLLITFSYNVLSQDDVSTGAKPERDTSSYYMFTKDEVLTITNNVKKLQAKVSAYDTLTMMYRSQILVMDEIIRKDEDIIKKYEDQIRLYKLNDSLYKKVIEDSKPSWYESPWIYFAGGVVAGFLIWR